MMFRGELLHIHTCPTAGAEMRSLEKATCIAGVGIEGDRYAVGSGFYSHIADIREVTLFEQETLIALERDHDITLLAHEHRRNLTVVAVPLNHLVGKQFRVGDVILEGGRLNTPCRYLDKLLGKPVCGHLRNRSGLNCRIIKGGTLRVGDTVSTT